VENIRHAILYCNSKAPPAGRHWKGELPALATSEVIRDFALIARQGAKRVFHCLVEKNKQLPRITVWIDNFNAGKADAAKIWYWSGRTAGAAYTALWRDKSSFAHAVAERVLRYPVRVGGALRIVTVHEAINTHSAAIVPAVLKQYGTPRIFFGVD